MNISEIEQLVLLVQGANISELTLRQEGARVTIRKSPPLPAQEESGALTLTREDDQAGGDFVLDMGNDSELQEQEENVVSIKSPLVGTFRHAKSPVVLGALVKAGQVVGVIEAMRLPNEVAAPYAGKVVEVMVEEGQFVEYGQELYALQPDNSINKSVV